MNCPTQEKVEKDVDSAAGRGDTHLSDLGIKKGASIWGAPMTLVHGSLPAQLILLGAS